MGVADAPGLTLGVGAGACSVAVVGALGHHLLDLRLAELRVGLGGVRADLREQLLVVIGLEIAVAEGAMNLS